jgi:hypothetical protein
VVPKTAGTASRKRDSLKAAGHAGRGHMRGLRGTCGGTNQGSKGAGDIKMGSTVYYSTQVDVIDTRQREISACRGIRSSLMNVGMFNESKPRMLVFSFPPSLATPI